MASNFKFKILNGTDPKAQYDAIASKDALTFYLLSTGVGYLGDTKLFDATDDFGLVTDMLGEGYTGDDTTAASTKAIVDYVTTKVNDTAEMLTVSFFRKVESHTLTEDDLANDSISIPEGCAAGDVGLLFTSDTDDEEGGETYYFVSLVDYLQNMYTFNSTNTVEMITEEYEGCTVVSANVKIDTTEESLGVGDNGLLIAKNKGGEIDETTADDVHLTTSKAVVEYVNKTDEIQENDVNTGLVTAEAVSKFVSKVNTVDEENASTGLVTEQALVNYIINSVLPAVDEAINEALSDVVTAVIDDGSTT